jgi:hypothetical protein
MKAGEYVPFFVSKTLSVIMLCCIPAVAAALDEDDAGGWQQDHVEKPDTWQESDAALPHYPEENNLLDLKIGTDGLQFTVYLDKPSLVVGDDGVVRYTVVLVPPSGVWNVSFEGLHCGEKLYRRYAYGVDGQWQVLKDSPWRAVQGSGANRYRRILYENYFCNPMRPYQSPGEMIESFSENWHEM